MFRIILSVVMVIVMNFFAYAEDPHFYGIHQDLEFIQTTPDRNGDTVLIAYMIKNGPATDCDRIIILEEMNRFFKNGYSTDNIRNLRKTLESRGIPITICNVVMGNIFHPERDVRYNTIGL